jgi:hypothetical protein
MASIDGRFVLASPDDDPSLTLPTIYLSLSPYKQRLVTAESIIKREIPTLIDTGANLTLIDATLASQCGLTQGKGVTVNTLGNKNIVPSFLTTIYVTEANITLNGDLGSAAYVGGGSPWRIIIGWDFLHHFDVIILKSTGIVRLNPIL